MKTRAAAQCRAYFSTQHALDDLQKTADKMTSAALIAAACRDFKSHDEFMAGYRDAVAEIRARSAWLAARDYLAVEYQLSRFRSFEHLGRRFA
jgi:hypothetical protein